MNWNFTAGDYSLRLPNSEQDVEALMGLLQQESLCAHVPYAPLTEVHRVVDELRRMAMRFEAREAAFWLVEKDGQLLGRIGLQRINWMQRSAQLQWELTPALDLPAMQQVLPALLRFAFDELNLHRIEMRLVASGTQDALLQGLGLHFEGVLPAQLEFMGKDVDLALWSLLKTDPH